MFLFNIYTCRYFFTHKLRHREPFEKVQAKLEEKHDFGPSKYYNKEIEKYRYELHWGNNTDNPVIQEYLTKKAEMPECPRCGKNMYFSKWGKHHSPTAGELQQYYCNPCNYEFMLFPELPPRTDVVKCPKCGVRKHVRKEGIYHNKTHGIDIQKYHCKKCNYCFQISPK